MLFTSFKAFPASCLCRFFMWDVFFFGTAFKMPSQISPSKSGMFREIEGIERVAEGKKGEDRNRQSCVAVLIWKSRGELRACGRRS
jgi:hypothetical protein